MIAMNDFGTFSCPHGDSEHQVAKKSHVVKVVTNAKIRRRAKKLAQQGINPKNARDDGTDENFYRHFADDEDVPNDERD